MEEVCGTGSIYPVLRIILTIFEILYIAIPIAVVIFVLVDIFKEVMSDNAKEMGLTVKRALKKILFMIFAFLLVPIVIAITNMIIGSSEDEGLLCLKDALSEFSVLGVSYSASDTEIEIECIKNGGSYVKIPISLFDESFVNGDYEVKGEYVNICTNGRIE